VGGAFFKYMTTVETGFTFRESKIQEQTVDQVPRRVRSLDIKYHIGGALEPDYVRNNTAFMDVTRDPDLLEATLLTVANNYWPLANNDNPNKRLSERDVYELLCRDGNEVDGRSVVLAAVTTLPHQQGRIVTSTMRFVFGRDISRPGMPAIAEMDLIDALWPNDADGKTSSSVATVGRYCLIQDVRGDVMPGIPGYLTGRLLELGFSIGLNKFPPVEYFCAVMPRRVVRNVRAGGIAVCEIPMKLKEIPGYPAGADLTRDNVALEALYAGKSEQEIEKLHEAVLANAYYDQFSNYWLPERSGHSDGPRLYQFMVGK
jgi:hypothetical protein